MAMLFFFFQAEDGIRDYKVTGVQTCALPNLCGAWSVPVPLERYEGEIYLGVRPEHVSLVAPDQGVGAAEVRGVSPLGRASLSHRARGGSPLAPRVPGIPAHLPAARVGGKLAPRHLHRFAPAGARLPW